MDASLRRQLVEARENLGREVELRRSEELDRKKADTLVDSSLEKISVLKEDLAVAEGKHESDLRSEKAQVRREAAMEYQAHFESVQAFTARKDECHKLKIFRVHAQENVDLLREVISGETTDFAEEQKAYAG